MMSFRGRFQAFVSRLQQNKHFMYGAPFLGLVLISSRVVSNFAQIRYDAKKSTSFRDEDFHKYGLKKTPEEYNTLEYHYEKYKKDTNLDDYEIVRGPRPWEDPNSDEATARWEEKRRNNKRMKPPVKTASSYGLD